MPTFLSARFHDFFLHALFLALLVLVVGVPYLHLRRRLRAILGQHNLWRDLEQTIGELTPAACAYYPNPSRHVLQSVLSPQPGVGRAGAVGPALDYLAAELDSPIGIVRSLSYLAVLVGLLGTVTLLALALQGVDAIGQFRIELLKNIYPLNSLAIGLAVIMFLSYAWYRHRADQFLLQVSRVLGRLRVDELGAADPALLATLEKVGEKFRDWGNEIQEHHRQEINRLLQEVQVLGEAIRELVTVAVAVRQEEDRALAPLLQAQDAKLELLNQRLYQNYLLLTQNKDTPEDFTGVDSGLGTRPRATATLRETRNRKKTGWFSRFFK